MYIKNKLFSIGLLVSFLMLFACGCGKATVEYTKDYFVNLDKESSLEDIVADIGPYGVQGSGIIYHVWKLDDGTEARVVFDSKGKIVMIYIVDDDYSERIYKREY